MSDKRLHREVNELVEGVLSGRVNRRQLIQRAAALGITVPGRPDDARPSMRPPRRDADSGRMRSPETRRHRCERSSSTIPSTSTSTVTQLAQSRNVMASVYETLTVTRRRRSGFPIKGRLAKEWTFTEPTKLDMNLQEGVTFHERTGLLRRGRQVHDRVRQIPTPVAQRHRPQPVDTVEVARPADGPLQPQATLAGHARRPVHDPDLLRRVDHRRVDRDQTKRHRSLHLDGVGARRPHHAHQEPQLLACRTAPTSTRSIFRPIKEKATSLSVMQAGDAEVFFTPELKDKATIDGDAEPEVGRLAPQRRRLHPLRQQQPRPDERPEHPPRRLLRTRSPDLLRGVPLRSGQKNTSPGPRPTGPTTRSTTPPSSTTSNGRESYLEAAGYTDGRSDGQQLSINIVYPKGYPEWQQGSEMFQAAMAELGVEVKVEELELATWIDRIVTTDEYDLSWDYPLPARRRSRLDPLPRLLLPTGSAEHHPLQRTRNSPN